MNFGTLHFGVLGLLFLTFAFISLLAGLVQLITGKGWVINKTKYSEEDFQRLRFPTALLAIANSVFVTLACLASAGMFSSFVQILGTMLAAVCIATGWLITKDHASETFKR
ncbi:MAG: hypothetical protein Q4E73_00495 [Lachnospiraceae bacterium]|nr:hypothetical protein [Lachnospiraceae bacterium]